MVSFAASIDMLLDLFNLHYVLVSGKHGHSPAVFLNFDYLSLQLDRLVLDGP